MAKSCHPVRERVEDLSVHGPTDLDILMGCQVSLGIATYLSSATGTVGSALPFTTVTPRGHGKTSSSIPLHLCFTFCLNLSLSLSSHSLLRVAFALPFTLSTLTSSRIHVNSKHEDHCLDGDPRERCSGARNARLEWICRHTTR